MLRNTLTSLIAAATLSGSALMVSASASQAGYDMRDGYVPSPKCHVQVVSIIVGTYPDGRLIKRIQRVKVCN